VRGRSRRRRPTLIRRLFRGPRRPAGEGAGSTRADFRCAAHAYAVVCERRGELVRRPRHPSGCGRGDRGRRRARVIALPAGLDLVLARGSPGRACPNCRARARSSISGGISPISSRSGSSSRCPVPERLPSAEHTSKPLEQARKQPLTLRLVSTSDPTARPRSAALSRQRLGGFRRVHAGSELQMDLAGSVGVAAVIDDEARPAGPMLAASVTLRLGQKIEWHVA
jgi:hypothetical protein